MQYMVCIHMYVQRVCIMCSTLATGKEHFCKMIYMSWYICKKNI